MEKRHIDPWNEVSRMLRNGAYASDVENATPIVEKPSCDHRVDVPGQLDKADAEAIVERLDEEDANVSGIHFSAG